MSLQTPVLFLIFNRPDATRQVFNVIRQVKPSQLFVAADGPRSEKEGEAGKCAECRGIVEKTIDWDCEVNWLLREKNLGCREAVSSSINWFFQNVEEGIILEDDCLPSPSFFGFCRELLAYYKDDSRVMQICGLNVHSQWKRNGCSYFFSGYGPVWGWASWRRAWKYNDVGMKIWPEIRANRLYKDFCQNPAEANHRLNLYDKVYSGEIDTWDYQWGFAKLINHGLSIIPSVNLIANIGFDGVATHTTSNNNRYAKMDISNLEFPLCHPDHILRDRIADLRYLEEFMSINPRHRIKQVLLRLVSGKKNE